MTLLNDNLITICICTKDRSDDLEKCLITIFNANSSEKVHVIVVDNSEIKKNNQKLKKKYQNKSTWLEQDESNLSLARNLALTNAKTQYVAFVDDDSLIDKKYFENFFKNLKIDADIFAGQIVPIWPDNYDYSWIPKKYIESLTILDRGNKSRYLNEYEYGYGTNIILKRKTAIQAGLFTANLGRQGSGNSLLSSEEIELQQRIRKDLKGKIYYIHDLVVHHRVHENRLSENFLRSRMSWQKVSDLISGEQINYKENFNNLVNDIYTKYDNNFLSFLLDNNKSDLETKINFDKRLVEFILTKHTIKDQENADLFKANDNRSYFFDRGKSNLVFQHGNDHEFLTHFFFDEEKVDTLILMTNPHESYFSCPDKYKKIIKEKKYKNIFFTTLDPIIYGPNYELIIDFLQSGINVHGILHRIYDPVLDKKSIFEKINLYVLSHFLYSKLLNNGIKSNVILHPNTLQNFENHLNLSSKEQIKKNMGVDGKFVISIIGGLRPGKGLEILNDALEGMEKSFLFNNYVVNICGTIHKSYYIEYQRLKNICDKKNIKILISNSSENYMINKIGGSELATEFDFLKSLFISDLGLLLYEGDQQDVSSNSLPLYSFFHVPAVALVGSYAAESVKKFNVGYVIDNSIQLKNLLTKGFLSTAQSFGFREFNNHNQKQIRIF